MSLYIKLDTSFWLNDQVQEAGHLAELLYIRALQDSRERLTDGFVSSSAVRRLCVGLPRGRKAVTALVDSKLWFEVAGGYQVPLEVWTRYNPTKAQVQEKREAEAERKREYRAKKAEARPANVPTGQGAESQGCPITPEPEPEPEPEPLPADTVSSKVPVGHVDNRDDDETKVSAAQVIEAIINHRTQGKTIANPTAYRRTIEANIRSELGTRIQDLANRYPTAPADIIAGYIETGTSTTLGHYATTEESA